MSEFILDTGAAAERFEALDAFTRGYIEALFFTDASDTDDECHGLDVADIAPEAWDKIVRDCAAFQYGAAPLLALAYDRDDYSEEQAGRDFWFTRNGHGVGFWDRDQLDAGALGDKLSALCRHESCDVYKGDDGRMYL